MVCYIHTTLISFKHTKNTSKLTKYYNIILIFYHTAILPYNPKAMLLYNYVAILPYHLYALLQHYHYTILSYRQTIVLEKIISLEIKFQNQKQNHVLISSLLMRENDKLNLFNHILIN